MRAGVQRFVFSSVFHPIINALRHHTAKLSVEEALYASGMRYAALHPTIFFQNIVPLWSKIVSLGVLAAPFSKDVPVSYVDYRDVAGVAALALTEDRLDFGTFELAAEGNPSREELAAIMSEVLGRKIEAAEPSFAEWSAGTDIGDDGQRRMLEAMYTYYNAHGCPGNALTLRSILGRAPRTFRSFVQELAGQ